MSTFYCPECDVDLEPLSNGQLYCDRCMKTYAVPEADPEMDGDEVEGSFRSFGGCPFCSFVGLFDVEGDGLRCPQCVAPIKNGDLVEVYPPDIHAWKGKLNGCLVCGNELPKDFSGDEYTCAFCGTIMNPSRRLSRDCPDCKISLSPNTIHIAEDDASHFFYCLDCQKVFEVPFESCPYCQGLAPISSVSVTGHSFYCKSCDSEWTSTAITNTELVDPEEDDQELSRYYQWFNREPTRTLDEKLSAALVVAEEI